MRLNISLKNETFLPLERKHYFENFIIGEGVMTINSIRTSAAPVAVSSAAPTPKAASTSTSTASTAVPASSANVTISSAARAMLAEATETAASTAKEAGSGDIQAQRLMAKEVAAKAAKA